MIFLRLMVYDQSFEESKLARMTRELKRGRSDDQGQLRFNKRAQYQESCNASKVNNERGYSSQFAKPTCTTCGKMNYEKCLSGTNRRYGSGNNDHKVRDCPSLATTGREPKQASYCGPDPDSPKKNRFHVLQAKESKEIHLDKDIDK